MEPAQLGAWLPNIVIGIFQLITVISQWLQSSQKSKKEQTAEDDATQQRLISNLKATVDLYEGKFKGQDERIVVLEGQQKTNMENISELTGKNKTLTELITGKDEESLKFREQGLQAIARVPVIEQLVVANNTMTTKLYELMEKHLDNIEHNLDPANAGPRLPRGADKPS